MSEQNGKAVRVPVDREQAHALVDRMDTLALDVYGGATNLLAAVAKDARLAFSFARVWESLAQEIRPLVHHTRGLWQHLE